MSCRPSPEARRRQTASKSGLDKSGSAVDGLRKTVNEDIKDFAETTMNELLGWYGYDKVSSSEARNLNLRSLSSSSSSSPLGTEDNSPALVSDEISEREGSSRDTPILDVDSISHENSNGGILCTWCLKNGLKLFTLKTANGQMKAFCSELCFDQCRRAAFKKNRACDWCKHVRHTVNYVDFQDKDHQLQFCSNKCLNQYKMNIFCNETQAYLQMHPYLQESGGKNSSSGASSSTNLITPELWMRDCRDSQNGDQESSEEEEDTEHYVPFSKEEEDVTIDSKHPAELFKSTRSNFKEPIGLKNDSSDVEDKNVIGNGGKHPVELTVSTTTPPIRDMKTEDTRLNRDKRKKHRVSDRDSIHQRPERRSSRHKSLTPEVPIKTTPVSLRSTNRHFASEQQRRMAQQPSSTSSYPPPPLINGSMASRNGGSPSIPLNLPSTLSHGMPSGLPPPPPLLNSELLHPRFLQMYQSPMNQLPMLPQHQLEAFLPAQNGLGMRLGMPPHQRSAFPEHKLPPVNPASSVNSANPLVPTGSVMLPYPLVLPLPFPIPIPIPIPLPHFLNLGKNKESKTNSSSAKTEKQARRVDTIVSKLMNRQSEERCQGNGDSRLSEKSTDCSTSIESTGLPFENRRNLRRDHRKSEENCHQIGKDSEVHDEVRSSKSRHKRSNGSNHAAHHIREQIKRSKLSSTMTDSS